ncbi:MAG: prolyl oligopeptidase family serine peptidase [Gemmatimonadetes bacterium]|uniref:Prolyl oligopeptidase family serine peptidase n=1 Tax=Candidatus Kutchimonas denitrificans TaxID=3056748 RepID=A0AAE5CBD9_9BACT|nr:prolyl oligopeptidase family serine peptidase [Gemmatimonadota bacterium]NIR75722.1 prolyl oligopeptidase family serine peptidase [Candidatus Kutchimonas denitrificans]NIS00335.1 prolyl oligopeptidase family serine peptidase [Gemmatimonadota bacterium]NIT65994.1 prolyl oligopeptidase family serine peptidase [Gemmatimonadota bacterium]NIU53698.1 prolyl oligopeptidase family serine peptidase [Gemmatimonadota bacterium]
MFGQRYNRLTLREGIAKIVPLMMACAAVSLACSDEPTGPTGDGVFGEWLRSGGDVRTYELRLPSSYDGSEPAPLLLAFHGNPDDAVHFEARTGLTPVADEAGFITVYPDGLGGTWGPWDNQLALDLIEVMSDSLSIDPERIYIAGYSAGGTRTQIIACKHSDVFSAAAVVGATLELAVYVDCPLRHPISTLFVHGTEDQAFPWGGLTSGSRRRLSVDETLELWTDLSECMGMPVVDTLPDRVDDGTRVWRELWTDCDGDSEVMFFGVEGGGHTWPSGPGPFPPGRITQEISSEEILEFLAIH